MCLIVTFSRTHRLPPVSTEPGTPTTVSSGSGLGLSIVKRILELHNARIQVSSLPQQGARFSFELPLAIWDTHIEPPDTPALPQRVQFHFRALEQGHSGGYAHPV